MPSFSRLQTRCRPIWTSEAALAIGVACCAFGIYLRTLYPGLVATGDSPKFQFVGRILGTAHNPGYPLYVVLSHFFSYLPLGSVAHRINLFSAVCGSAAVAFVTLAARRLGTGRAVASVTALSFGFGPVFWSQCLTAEVYAMAAALLAAIVWTLAAWRESGQRRWLRAAVVLAAVSLGHHLTIVTVVPALVLFVLLTDAREGLRPRLIAFVAVATLLGLAQYSYVVLRTYQNAAYLGSSARNLAELLDVVRGHQFGNRMFVFGASQVLRERVPLIGSILSRELGFAGVVLTLLGALALARRQQARLVLLLGGAAGVIAFALNYGVPDIAVFLTLSLVLLWLVAGIGIETLLAAARRLASARAAAIIAGLAFALPGFQLLRSFQANDHSDRTFEMRYFNALFTSLPARVAFVNENHSVDHMLLYKIYAEDGEKGREIYPTPARAADVERRLAQGMAVFAFENGRRALKHQGFELAPVRLADRPLAAFLKEQPAGRLVAVASAGHAGADASARLLHGLGLVPEPRARAFAWLYASSAPDQGRLVMGAEAAEVVAAKGDALAGVRLAGAMHVSSSAQSGCISLEGRELVCSDDGVAVAVLDRDGSVLDRQTIGPASGWRAAFPERSLPLWRVVGRRATPNRTSGLSVVSAAAE